MDALARGKTFVPERFWPTDGNIELAFAADELNEFSDRGVEQIRQAFERVVRWRKTTPHAEDFSNDCITFNDVSNAAILLRGGRYGECFFGDDAGDRTVTSPPTSPVNGKDPAATKSSQHHGPASASASTKPSSGDAPFVDSTLTIPTAADLLAVIEKTFGSSYVLDKEFKLRPGCVLDVVTDELRPRSRIVYEQGRVRRSPRGHVQTAADVKRLSETETAEIFEKVRKGLQTLIWDVDLLSAILDYAELCHGEKLAGGALRWPIHKQAYILYHCHKVRRTGAAAVEELELTADDVRYATGLSNEEVLMIEAKVSYTSTSPTPLRGPWIQNGQHFYVESGEDGNKRRKLSHDSSIESDFTAVSPTPLLGPWIQNFQHFYVDAGEDGDKRRKLSHDSSIESEEVYCPAEPFIQVIAEEERLEDDTIETRSGPLPEDKKRFTLESPLRTTVYDKIIRTGTGGVKRSHSYMDRVITTPDSEDHPAYVINFMAKYGKKMAEQLISDALWPRRLVHRSRRTDIDLIDGTPQTYKDIAQQTPEDGAVLRKRLLFPQWSENTVRLLSQLIDTGLRFGKTVAEIKEHLEIVWVSCRSIECPMYLRGGFVMQMTPEDLTISIEACDPIWVTSNLPEVERAAETAAKDMPEPFDDLYDGE